MSEIISVESDLVPQATINKSVTNNWTVIWSYIVGCEYVGPILRDNLVLHNDYHDCEPRLC